MFIFDTTTCFSLGRYWYISIFIGYLLRNINYSPICNRNRRNPVCPRSSKASFWVVKNTNWLQVGSVAQPLLCLLKPETSFWPAIYPHDIPMISPLYHHVLLVQPFFWRVINAHTHIFPQAIWVCLIIGHLIFHSHRLSSCSILHSHFWGIP